MNSSSLYHNNSQPPTAKQLKKVIRKLYYPQPQEKQFIAYSMALKESSSGMSSHERLILFDSKFKSLKYYSKMPEPLPTIEENPQGKQTIYIKKLKNFKFKSTRTNIGRAAVEWNELDGTKKSWLLSFGSNQILNEWVLMVNEVKKDGHLKPENRPPTSSVRRNTKIQPQKYLTEFMKETQDQNTTRSREKSMTRKPFWEKSKSKQKQVSVQNRNDEKWLSLYIENKERKVEKEHRSLIDEDDRRKEKELITLREIEYQHKLQEKERELEQLKRRQEMSERLREKDREIEVEKERQQKANKEREEELKKKGESFILQSTQKQGQRQKEKQIQRESQRQKERQINEGRFFLMSHLNEEQKKREEGPKTIRQEDNLQTIKKAPQRKEEKEERKYVRESYSRQTHPYINTNECYIDRHERFIRECEKCSESFINNLKQILQQLERASSPQLYFENNCLHLQKSHIIFSINLMPQQSMWCYQQLMIQQIQYMYNKAYECVPICCIQLKGYKVICKSTIPFEYEVREKGEKCIEYQNKNNRQDVIVEYLFKQVKEAHEHNPLYLEQFSRSILEQQVFVTCLQDLYEQLLMRYGIIPTQNTLIKLSKLFINDSKWYSDLFNHMLYGIMVSMQIKNNLRKNNKMGEGQLMENTYDSIRQYLNPVSQSFKEIWKYIHQLTLNTYQNYYPHIVMSTIIFSVSLSVTQNHFPNLYNLQFKYMNFGLQFKTKIHHMQVYGFAQADSDRMKGSNRKNIKHMNVRDQSKDREMRQVREILLKSEKQAELHDALMEKYDKYQKYRTVQGTFGDRILNYKYIYIPYTQGNHVKVQQFIKRQPTTYYTMNTSINMLKWLIKYRNHSLVKIIFHNQLELCKFWVGEYSPLCLQFYELATNYFTILYDYEKAILYGRKVYQIANSLYGVRSEQTIEKLYLLGNIYMQAQYMPQSLDTYRQCLNVIQIQEKGKQVQIVIRRKMANLLLAMGNTDQCLQQCLYCLKMQLQLSQSLWIYGQIIKCYQILRKYSKMTQMIQVTSNRFNGQESAQVRQQFLQICIYPYLRQKVGQENRRNYLSKLVSIIQEKYESRYSHQEYHSYLLKFSKRYDVLQQLSNALLSIPVYYSNKKVNFSTLQYSLYDTKNQSHDQDTRLVIQTMRLMEVISGVVGYEYMRSCF